MRFVAGLILGFVLALSVSTNAQLGGGLGGGLRGGLGDGPIGDMYRSELKSFIEDVVTRCSVGVLGGKVEC